MLLQEFCTNDVVFCSRETTVLEAAQLMRQKCVGDVIVVDDPDENLAPVGVITDRDIAVKVVAAELNPADIRVGEIMRTPVVIADEMEDTSVAIARMRHYGIRRLPVTGHHGKLVGVITLDDLLRRLRYEVDTLLDIVAKEQEQERRPCSL